MINFFRKIRQKLISENRFSKYLLYALGEIILVVIGILIALQVNSWKEENQARNYELKILAENLKLLKVDHERFANYLGELDEVDKSVRYLINHLNSDNTETDSLDFHINSIRWKNFMIYNKSAYESLKSGGLERITNDSIRTALSNLYETYLPGAEIMINSVAGDYFKTWENNYSSLLLDGYHLDQNGMISEQTKYPTRVVLEDPRFEKMIECTVGIVDICRRSYQNYLLPDMTRTISLIESELGQD